MWLVARLNIPHQSLLPLPSDMCGSVSTCVGHVLLHNGKKSGISVLLESSNLVKKKKKMLTWLTARKGCLHGDKKVKCWKIMSAGEDDDQCPDGKQSESSWAKAARKRERVCLSRQ